MTTRRIDFFPKSLKQHANVMINSVLQEGQNIRIYFHSNTISAGIGGQNPITHTPVKPFPTGGGTYDPWDETVTSASVKGIVRHIDSSQAYRALYKMGEYEPGMVEIVTRYSDVHNSSNVNVFMLAEYFTIGNNSTDRYVARTSVPDNFHLVQKTVAKKIEDNETS